MCKHCADELIDNTEETPLCPECGDEISEEDGVKVPVATISMILNFSREDIIGDSDAHAMLMLAITDLQISPVFPRNFFQWDINVRVSEGV